jgi:MOSC domain-containing protein YiiM
VTSLADGVEQIIGLRPPDELPVGQWLAERNLGLVPIADPRSFAWPGYWLARSGDEIVLMYGSPSGPVDRELPGAIDEGWVIARLDLEYAKPVEIGSGVVEAILVAPAAEAPMARVESTAAVAGHGLEGDRYRDGRGTFSGGVGYELTLVDAGNLEELGIRWEQSRRNVVTRGIDLNALVGHRFAVGDVECVARRLAEPCAHLERVEGKGLMRPLVHKAGLRADIVVGGTIAIGDAVRPL